ncbi:ATP-dependent (S)-NAD(P)H-hydrate dehydratase [Lamellibrachia satsuma]|nr:ATP-dependent (S)-NAD(P)H-hydrate dehydratase [Lamellibrachia satsuma]
MHILSQGIRISSELLSSIMSRGLMSSQSHGKALIEMARSVIPPLAPSRHKGQAGRIAVVGGCKEYTGAPYFAAISVLKIGGDLSHVFCASEAAPVIKSYSPELIVHPILDSSNGVSEISRDWLPRMHSVVIGPGLGRDSQLLNNVKGVIETAKELQLPLVIDADGVYLVTMNPDIIRDYNKAILTPNVVEYARLFETILGRKPDSKDAVDGVIELSKALGGVTIVRKGPEDIITDGSQSRQRQCQRQCHCGSILWCVHIVVYQLTDTADASDAADTADANDWLLICACCGIPYD